VPGLDLHAYREQAERFLEAIDREYYLHLSGQKPELEIAGIYEEHADLFGADAVARLREAAVSADGGDEGRAHRYLLTFAFEGHLGQATKADAEEIAGLEASLEVEVDGKALPYRQIHVELATEQDAARRRELEGAAGELLASRITPIHMRVLEQAHELCRQHGWSSYAAAQQELRGIDLPALAHKVRTFMSETDGVYEKLIAPRLEASGLPPLGEARRCDVPRLMRSEEHDDDFPEERLIGSFEETLAGLGFTLADQANVHLDAESRPTKTPRAFCSPVQVPGEVYLVFAPIGGREDYGALFHEGGHTEHFANTDASLAFEFRHLGDNSVTESFAFLMEHLTETPSWLRSVLAIADPEASLAQSRATKLLYLRRYGAKLQYELELHAENPDFAALPDRYAELIGGATRLGWPREPWLDDVDGGFYVACYLRAWALEAHWRRALRDRFGESWFAVPEAGDWLRDVWSEGQRLNADELLADRLGEQLDFSVLLEEFAAPA
jgi:hypothetical protein